MDVAYHVTSKKTLVVESLQGNADPVPTALSLTFGGRRSATTATANSAVRRCRRATRTPGSTTISKTRRSSLAGYGGLTLRNGYSARGELIGQHYYPAGSSTFTTAWPHFSRQPSLGYMIPTSEDVPANVTTSTAFYQGDDVSYTSTQYDASGNLIQGHGWGQDAAHRQAQDRYYNQPLNILGVVSRGYDSFNHLTQWTVLSTDPKTGAAVTGWPVMGQNAKPACNAAPPTSVRAVIEKGPAVVSETPPPQLGVLAARAPFPPGGVEDGRRSFIR